MFVKYVSEIGDIDLDLNTMEHQQVSQEFKVSCLLHPLLSHS